MQYKTVCRKTVLIEKNNATPAEAAGLMLEWLVDNKYVKVEDVNK